MHYFSNLFLNWNSIYFGQFLCPSSGVFHCAHSNGVFHTGLLTACEQGQDVQSWSCSQAVIKPVWHIPLLCVQWKTPDDGRRNCPRHVKFQSKNKFEKLVYLVGFVIRNLSRCTVTWTSNLLCSSQPLLDICGVYIKKVLYLLRLLRYRFFISVLHQQLGDFVNIKLFCVVFFYFGICLF